LTLHNTAILKTHDIQKVRKCTELAYNSKREILTKKSDLYNRSFILPGSLGSPLGQLLLKMGKPVKPEKSINHYQHPFAHVND